MGDIVELDAFRRAEHVQGPARCLCCGHQWHLVAPVGTAEFECPACGLMKGRLVQLVYRLEQPHRVCRCGNDLFHVTPEGPYCPTCCAWQKPS